MKTTNKTLVAVLTGIALFSFVGTAQAQYKATGDDGITASPKLRQLRDERKHAVATPAASSDRQEMACPTCKNKVTERVDYTARGAAKPIIKVTTHLCEGCSTTIATVGVGKQARNMATHKCTSSGAETLACCNATKGSNAVIH